LIDKTKIERTSIISCSYINFKLLINLKISYYGSAIATIAAYGSMMIISYKMGQKKYPIPYDINKIMTYLGVTILFSAISFYILM
jgi:hypothetical protein